MVHAEDVTEFLTECSMRENIYLSLTLDQSLTNRAIHDYCMCDNMKIVNAKDHLKQDAFKSMINKTHCTRQRQWVKQCMMKCLNNGLSD